ncbi:porphobilinogen synthase [Corynebacterium ammoniagenes]|uniref:Delta-aminolevulinic acid dehydratase n=2 Tax=Corynebacterium ammoniagenes TaxID=1697 RepID=A0AAV5G117_CORAM|nr:porphobilinogen synthase [Corynebacterium ammoniagenes]APT81751.1 delta-aminolevulinic acid dehydratase [Corynebacterium ammoniagenes DSM 20306]AQS72867.1 delta-aminolevulinic acid dehydratase [Corynebacterium ammoniagenes]GJN41559.1 delta-aminolevulinic acid dehydratase [Corynebacterium ammoniagenes]
MSYFPHRRPRRLRQNPAMRQLVAETQLSPRDLILPMFFADGIEQPKEISSMPGVYQHTEESLVQAVREAYEAGVRCVDLFGVPREEDKDAQGSPAWDPEGVLNRALRLLRKEFGNDILLMADTCLDEFTDHGHCGVLDEQGRVDNDATLELYVAMAIAQARAGAHIVSPSGMMDGQIGVIREGLDAAGFEDVAIMAYSAKYASAFFGPFREAVGSSLEGDRRTYQQDPANYRESMLEVDMDIEEGADFVMVKPALPYLDVLAGVAERSPVPVAAYQVSGEYAMIKAAGANGWIDEKAVMMESLISIKRAGADQIFTYFATEAARMLAKDA